MSKILNDVLLEITESVLEDRHIYCAEPNDTKASINQFVLKKQILDNIFYMNGYC